MNEAISPLYKVQRRLPAGEPVDIAATLRAQWQQLDMKARVQGKRIAIGVGSRGVAKIVSITRCLVDLIREAGGDPFVIPAMGSHGGATPEGQIHVLHSLGVTETTVGCPLRATMETVVLGHTADGLAVHMDRFAAEADGLFIVNRIKLHTDFHGRYESGLMKMLAIGLGKQVGAAQLHDFGVHGLRDLMPTVAAVALEQSNLIAGIATVEDGYHRPVELALLLPDQIPTREPQLLERAWALFPRLPVKDIDVLIVEELGKEISGSGMDTNVIGRMRIPGVAEPESPSVKALVVLDITAASHGNALGIGLADFTVRRLVDKIDFELMAKNVLTSGFLERGHIPMVYNTDESAIAAALSHVFRKNPSQSRDARIVRVRNTLALEEIWVSDSLLDEVKASAGFVAVAEAGNA